MFTIYSSVLKRIKFFSGGTCAAAYKRAAGREGAGGGRFCRARGGGRGSADEFNDFFLFCFYPFRARDRTYRGGRARSAPLSRGCRLHPLAVRARGWGDGGDG